MPGSSAPKHLAGSSDVAPRGRIGIFDVVRGAAVVSMVLFHLCYDLKYLSGMDLAWFASPLQDIWRCSISWTFLFIAGCMCPLSRNNLKRAAVYGAFALLIYAVTYVAAVDEAISFGIIFCMAACTLVAWILQKLDVLPKGRVAAIALFAIFLFLQPITKGYVGAGAFSISLPEALYSTEWLSWLGFPGPTFVSGDYYPLLPYLFMYLAGAAIGSHLAERGYPKWAREAHAGPLSFIGRHALAVYVIHQPVLLVITGLL